jgi:hypothetical protein
MATNRALGYTFSMVQFRVALVGDYDKSVIAHQAIPEALRLAACAEQSIESVWIQTASIRDAAADLTGLPDVTSFRNQLQFQPPTWSTGSSLEHYPYGRNWPVENGVILAYGAR